MSLVIRRKGNKNFFHYFSIGGTAFEYSASDLTIIIDNNKAKLRSLTGRPIALKDGYTVNQITIFDDSTGGGAETFATFILLTQRLIDLGYPAYYQDGQIILNNKIINFYLSGVDTVDTLMNNTSQGEKLTSVFVPANTFKVGDIVELICRCVKVGEDNSAVVLLSVDTTDESSSNFMGQWGGGATNLTYYQGRKTWVIKSNNTEYLAAQTNTDYTNNFIENRSIDWTINQYIVVSAKSASITDTMRVSYLEINIKRP